jgi:hypothetical protein
MFILPHQLNIALEVPDRSLRHRKEIQYKYYKGMCKSLSQVVIILVEYLKHAAGHGGTSP